MVENRLFVGRRGDSGRAADVKDASPSQDGAVPLEVSLSILFQWPIGRNAMQVGLVMVIALSGLGCQNKGGDVAPSAQTHTHSISSPSVSHSHPNHGVGTGCPLHGAAAYSDSTATSTFHGAVRSTLWSFVLGRDPDVATASEIEANLEAGRYGAASYPTGYGH